MTTQDNHQAEAPPKRWRRVKGCNDFWTSASGFRLIRVFTPEHNARRLTVYCARLCKTADHRKFSKRLRLLKLRRRDKWAQGSHE